MKAIVMGTDFSAASENALSWALTIGRVHRAVVHLVYAVTRNLPFVDRLEAYSRLGRFPSSFDEERLASLANKLRSPDQQLECHLENSRPSVAILEVARRVEAQLIVLGTRGRGGFRELRIGSTAERVTQRAKCPVLAVSPESRHGLQMPRRVLIATDLSGDADRALLEAERIFQLDARKAGVLLLAALEAPEGLERNAEMSTLWRGYVTDCRALLGERLESLQTSLEAAGLEAEAMVREGVPAEQIVRVAIEEEMELIAMGSRGAFATSRALLGSVSKRVIQTAPCPILAIPSGRFGGRRQP